MAFDQKNFVSRFSSTKTDTSAGFDPKSFVEKYSNIETSSKFDVNTFSKRYSSVATSKNRLDTSNDLYNLAVESGLQDRADAILASQSGEKTKEIFSGGFISDIFDVINAFDYGVVGLLKGKTFAEGVKTRQSFADEDALGSKGLPGVILGTILDIAVDPLTYIAPTTILGKIPGATKAAKAVKAIAFGELVEKGIQGTDKTYQALEGGTKAGKYLASKFAWMSGADPVFKDTFERSSKNIAVTTQAVADLGKEVAKIEPETAAKILARDPTGRFERTPLQSLVDILSPEELDTVSKIYTRIDELGKEAVDLGLLSKTKYEENLGTYLKNAYEEFELAKKDGLFGSSKFKIGGIKSRSKGLTQEGMEKLGQINNPAYLLFKSAFDLNKDVQNAKLFKTVSERFGSDVAQEGFAQVPKTAKYTTTTGKQAELLTGVKKINTDLKPLFSELRQTFKADRAVLSEIADVEKQFSKLVGLQADELYKFFQEGEKMTKLSKVVSRVRTIPEVLQPVANLVKKFDNLSAVEKSSAGVELERLFINGDLERAGFSSMKEFFDAVKNPFKEGSEKLTEKIAKGDISKIVNLQAQIERLMQKSSNLKSINKTSINDSFRYLEKTISDLKFAKEDLLGTLADTKLGDLAGRYIPEQMFEYLKDIISPPKDTLTKQLVGNFKFFKVVMNPGTHARNIVSNKILNYWKLGMNPLDPRVIKTDFEAAREVLKGSGKWTDIAKPHGYNLDTFASAELKNLLDSPEVATWGNKLGKTWGTVKKKLGDIYQAEENQAKLSAFIFNMKHRGLDAEQAWRAAESATFNYAQVTPFVRKLRESLFGFPFITFTIKATPVAVETIVKNPQRVGIIGKVKNSIENLSDIKETDRERSLEPAWVRDGFYVKLPIKDKEGRSSYFDMTYILPFGDLVAGNFFERSINLDTGLPESVPTSLLKKSPFIALIAELGKNKDFYGNKIWKESDTTEQQLADLMRHLTKTIAPPLVGDNLKGGYNEKGVQQQRGIRGALTPQEEENQQRTVMQELLRNVGAKIQPIDADVQETYTEWNKKKALQALLLENGVLNTFSKTYIPKEE